MSPRPLFARRPADPATDVHRAVVLDSAVPADAAALRRLRRRRDVTVVDERAGLAAELADLRPAVGDTTGGTTWAWYPWRRTLVTVPPVSVFHVLRLDRNRQKITVAEQERFRGLRIGVVGLSVGHAIAYTLAQEGLCGGLRLADLDTIELSNLNRIPASMCDLGTNKAVAVARRVAELDPYLDTQVFLDGLTEARMDEFFDGLDLVIEECDSLDMKVRVREEARRRGVPVFMETSDRGLFDVERFDLDPHRPLFHGLLGDVTADALRGLSSEDKAPHVMRILETGKLSARMAASMVEIDRTVSSWPQLAGDVQLGGATVAAAVRRFGRGEDLPSGRVRVDLDRTLAALGASHCAVPLARHDAGPPPVASEHAVDLTAVDPGPDDAVVHAVRLAPSGGNIQPWTITPTSDGGVDIDLVPARTSAMDVRFRGSYVAIGAGAFNATVAAARYGRTATVTAFPDGTGSGPVVSVRLFPGADPELADLYPAMVRRITNRGYGQVRPLTPEVADALHAPAAAVGARLRIVTDRAGVAKLADMVAASDRIRFLTPLLHRQMMGELRWSTALHAADGIDVATLGMDAADLAKLEVAARADVMAELVSWGGGAGAALGDNTRERMNSSSAIAVLTVDADRPADYVRGGMALEHLWIRAERYGLGVHPVSPVFLYARDDADRRTLSPTFADELGVLQQQFGTVVGMAPSEAPILVLRLSHGTALPPARSRRLDRDIVSPRIPTAPPSGDPTNGPRS